MNISILNNIQFNDITDILYIIDGINYQRTLKNIKNIKNARHMKILWNLKVLI